MVFLRRANEDGLSNEKFCHKLYRIPARDISAVFSYGQPIPILSFPTHK